MAIRNINPELGDRVTFESVEEMEQAVRELESLNGGEWMPEDGLREGRDYEVIPSIEYFTEEQAEENMDLCLCHECDRYFDPDINAGDVLYNNLDSDIAYCRNCASGSSFEMRPGYTLQYNEDIYEAEERRLIGSGKLIILHEREA